MKYMNWLKKSEKEYPPIELISIHIPKTGGTTFYAILEQIYGEQVSISIKRRHLKKGKLQDYLNNKTKVLHGHLYYSEIKKIHFNTNVKIICWLRDPVERVLSNYRFFIKNLRNPEKSKHPNFYKELYLPNKHRINEPLLEYAAKEETQNKMSKFLKGITLEELFFFGFLESFNEDINILCQRMNWIINPNILHLNHTNITAYPDVPKAEIEQIKEWNTIDIAL
ncbi:MAG: hypothetical protein ACI94Y_004393, partial [Maribacter sp.]